MGSKKRKKSRKSRSKPQNDETIDDERFQAAVNRPQFAKPQQESNKVVLDDRFASVLVDPRFQLQEKDKYGRKKKKQQSEELSAFYRIENKQDNESDNNDESHKGDSKKQQKDPVEQESDEESVQDPASRIKYLTALSRGELSVSSSSSSSDDENEDDSDASDSDSAHDETKEAIYGTAGVLDPSLKTEEVPLTETPSPYLAVMNMDWQHVRAVDLFAILSSFTPPGALKRVQVFPSNFGLERMAKEAQHGPTNVWKKPKSTTNSENDDDDDISTSSSDDDDEPMDDNDMSDSDSENDSEDEHERYLKQIRKENEEKESDFDTEKLRAYEASKLKYYFAVVEFASPEHADVAYKEVDGLELERSSAAMDLRSIPPDGLESVIKDRELRDEATSIPSNYQPPDFVVSALQLSSVKCTWEDGDEDRRRKLTGYGTGQPGTWAAATEDDDLRAYLASEGSSSEDDDSDAKAGNGKASKMRKMLGLEESDDVDNDNSGDGGDAKESSSEEEEEGNDFEKQVTFIPGKAKLEDRIRSKLQAKNEEELTPWEKYQAKRKEKRRERRQARRKLRKEIVTDENSESGSDPEFRRAEFESEDEIAGVDDDFFLESAAIKSKKKNGRKNSLKPQEDGEVNAPSTKEELELLLAGDNDEEDEKDYNMRGLQRIEKNKRKKLRGSRKRKEKELANTVSGKEFHIDTKDSRFAAVLEGTDDRFGIDRTNPNYKETEAMKEILSEQTKRRKANKKRKKAKVTHEATVVAPNVNAVVGAEKSSGAAALSSLVASLKTKVAKNTSQ